MDAYLGDVTAKTVLICARYPGQILSLGELSATSTEPDQFIRVYGTGPVYLSPGDWDCIAIVEGLYEGPYFDGSNPQPGYRSAWTGEPNASTSVATEYPPAEDRAVVPLSSNFWFIDVEDQSKSVKIAATAHEETEEYESASYGIVGRGRHRDIGERWGYTGTLVLKVRQAEVVARVRERLEALKRSLDVVYLRTPFGKVYQISIGDLGWSALPGTPAEMGDLTIPYEEVN